MFVSMPVCLKGKNALDTLALLSTKSYIIEIISYIMLNILNVGYA
jgi:hypothetical protein